MCVIFYVDKERPTDDMITRAWDSNKDGGGIAWQEGSAVVWKKGIMKLEEFREIIHKAPTPYVAHFRVASCGGVKQTLTHPFPIGQKTNLALEGRTRGGVLFHNGHWQPWQEKVVDAAIAANVRLPLGADWTDTRALAFMVSLYGPSLLDLLPSQRGIIVTPDTFQIFTGPGWVRINGVWCSNDIFWYGRRHNHGGHHHNSNTNTHTQTVVGRYCSRGRCMKQALPGRDVCKDCADERAAEANGNVAVTDVPAETKQPTALQLISGGTQRPLAGVLTLKELESYRNSGDVSKNKYKKFKKLHGELHQGSNRKRIRTAGLLETLSNEIAESVIERLARAGGTN